MKIASFMRKILGLRWIFIKRFLALRGIDIGKNTHVHKSILMGKKIKVGDDTRIGHRSMLMCLSNNARIEIGQRCLLTQGVQIYSGLAVTIEDDCMVAGGVFITDTTHSTKRGDIPYSKQGLTDPSPVIIRSGAWIGQNVVIMPGCDIGINSVIGANSVVTHSIPPNSIAVGSPARVIKQFIPGQAAWVRV